MAGPVIPGFFEPALLQQPLIRIAIRITALSDEWIPVTMILDTGASLTCIHAATAIELFEMSESSLDPANWPPGRTVVGIGGARRYLELDAEFGFGRVDGVLEVLPGKLQVGEISSRGVPPILGWDLIQHFQLFIDGPAGVVELRKP